MYVYDFNVILTTTMKNRSNKEIIWVFTELTKDLKSRGINPGFNFKDNESLASLELSMTTMDIEYHWFSQSNYREYNVERSIQDFKNYFILVLCSVDKRLLSPIVGQIPTAGENQSKSSQTIKNSSQPISLHIHI